MQKKKTIFYKNFSTATYISKTKKKTKRIATTMKIHYNITSEKSYIPLTPIANEIIK